MIAGHSKGDSDGSQSHSKLCQPIGICVEFDRNIYVTDSGSGAIKLISRPLTGIAEFLGKLQVLVKAFNIHSKKSAVRETRSSVHEAIDMVDEVLEYVKSCSRRARELQSLASETTDGPEGTLSNKCLKSLEPMAQSLRKVENNIKDLSSYPGFEVNLNLESLLTLNVENQHAVTHFKKETFTLYEYAQIFGSSVEEGVKRVTPWSAHYYTHPSSYYLAEPSAAGQLVSVEIPKPVGERLSRNEEAEMRLWAKRFGKYVRQRNVRQDNTMDRAGTLPLNLYETQTSLNPLDLQFVFPHAQNSVPDESPESETDEHPVEVITCTDQRDDYSSSESGDSESDEDCADDRIGFHMVMSTRAGRERVFTSRMRDFLQSRWRYVYPNSVSQCF